jgi:hypothetical protein
MGLQMYHHNEIARALRMLVQGAAALTVDTDGSDIINTDSSPLFESGTAVRLIDDQGQVESHTVVERLSARQVRLDDPVAGEFGVAEGARLQLTTGTGAQLKWVSQGRPELMPRAQIMQLPAVVVEPVTLEQPASAGTNRTYQQEYKFHVYYIRKMAEGEQANVELQEELGDLFNLVMADPYLGETCWHAQVTEVQMRPAEEEKLRAVAPGVQAVRMEVVATRSEPSPPTPRP